jgi:carboxyl-terminal processing protease
VIELTDEQKEELIKNRTEIGSNGDPQYAKALEVLSKRIKNPTASVN